MQGIMKRAFHLAPLVLLPCIISFHVVSSDASSEDVRKLSGANLKFALDFYRTALKQSNERSFISSPFSVSTLFSMIYSGARQDTAKELEKALHYDEVGIDNEGVQSGYKNILEQMTSADIANSVWSDKRFRVLPAFRECLETNFRARVNEVDFGNGSTTDAINDWVNQQTRGKITSLFDYPLPSTTLLALVNAIYFKGTWKTTFPKDRTKDRDFRGELGVTKKPMMNVQAGFKYYESPGLNSQVLELDYTDGNMSFLVILPNENYELKKVEANLETGAIEDAIEHLHYVQKLKVTIPKFRLENKFDLIPIMGALNVHRLFDSRADLSGISEQSGGLYVTEAVQKAYVDVNEEGTEAAAASGAALGRSVNIGKEFRADRPFLFIIRNTENNLVLFVGRVA